MPTISRLIAALIFAATAYVAGEAFKLGMPEGVQYGLYSLFNALIGCICGWMVMGGLAGRGYGAAVGAGLRTAITTALWALLLFSIILMVRKAFKKRYDSPLEAVVDIFALALEHGQLMLTPQVLLALGLGGLVGGIGAEWAKRRWD